jgi:hypothetical protein
MHEFGNAADAIAAHFSLASIGVKHPHSGIGLGTWANKDQAIPADSFVPVCQHLGQVARPLGFRLMKTIEVNVIVSRSMKLEK